MIAMKAMRRPTAPIVPQRRPCHCCLGGSFRTARAMTRALSPARVRSRITIWIHRTQNSALLSSARFTGTVS